MSVIALFRQRSTSVLRYRSNRCVRLACCDGFKKGTKKSQPGAARYEKNLLQLPWLTRRLAPPHFCRHFRGTRIPGELDHSEDLPSQGAAFLDPVGTIVDELQALIQVLIATWIMARIERRRFPDYGIPVATPSESISGWDLPGARLPLLCSWA